MQLNTAGNKINLSCKVRLDKIFVKLGVKLVEKVTESI
jgi:hypothetical protein